MPGSETFSPFLTADIRTSFSLLLSSRSARLSGKSGCRTPDLGDTWKFGCPKGPMWESQGEGWHEDKSVSSSDSREDNVCNVALHVIGLYEPGDKVSLFLEN